MKSPEFERADPAALTLRRLRLENVSASFGEHAKPSFRASDTKGFERTFAVLQFVALIFSALCGVAYFLLGEISILLMGGVISVFFLLTIFVRRVLFVRYTDVAVVVGCSAILCSTIVSLFVQPAIYQTLAVTALLTVSVALPYTGERALKILMFLSWISVVVIGVLGPQLATGEESIFDTLFGAATVGAAAGVSLFVLWQFKSRLMGSLEQAHAAEDLLRYQVTHDSLTGLANRALLSQKLSEVLSRPATGAGPYALLFLDIDRFKHVNDSLGHNLGDELLKVVAARLRSGVRETDAIFRMGGDEFVVLMENAYPGDAEALSRRIQDALAKPVRVRSYELYITTSIGILESLSGYTNPEDPIRDADTAMYAAKSSGRARFVVFDDEMRRSAVSLLQLEHELRRAVEQGEFVVHYQPVVWLSSGCVSGFEALVRWNHPEYGLLGPHVFLKMAEETGLIHDIDRFVMREACRQISAWRRSHRDPFPPTVSINISPTGLSRKDLIGEVARILDETGIPGYAVVLELTESAVMEDAESSMETFYRLRELGVRIHVDDFGTGYSSLQLLHRLPVDALKIDRSFISSEDCDGMSENSEIVQTILTMAHALGMEVVAEGVETEDHLTMLREMGCDYVQGYHFSRPVTADQAENILVSEPVW